jgi:hypothetical protein
MRRIETNIFRRSPVIVPSTRTATTSIPMELSGGLVTFRRNNPMN